MLASEGSLSKPMLRERVAHVMANPRKRDFVVGLGLTAEQTAERRIGYDNDIRQFNDITTLELERITAPTLVVHGTADSDVPYSHGEFAAAQIPGGELLTLDTGTHLAFYTHPDSHEAQRRRSRSSTPDAPTLTPVVGGAPSDRQGRDSTDDTPTEPGDTPRRRGRCLSDERGRRPGDAWWAGLA